MVKKILLTVVFTVLIITFITISVMGINNEFPCGWLNIVVQAFWLLIFMFVIGFDVWNKLD